MSAIITSISDDYIDQICRVLGQAFHDEIGRDWIAEQPERVRLNRWVSKYAMRVRWSTKVPGEIKIAFVTRDGIEPELTLNLVQLSRDPTLMTAYLMDTRTAINRYRAERAARTAPVILDAHQRPLAAAVAEATKPETVH